MGLLHSVEISFWQCCAVDAGLGQELIDEKPKSFYRPFSFFFFTETRKGVRKVRKLGTHMVNDGGNLAHYLDATRRSSNLPANTPLFKFTCGTPLTRAVFTQHIQRALTETGFTNSSRFMSHFFRIGAATTAAEVGVAARLIKTMGRSSSEAYQQYIRTPLATWLAVAQQLNPLRSSEPSASTSTQSRTSPDTQPHS